SSVFAGEATAQLDQRDQSVEGFQELVGGFACEDGRWTIDRRAVLEQTIASPELDLTLGIQRPLELAHTEVRLRLEVAGQVAGEWIWAADGSTDEALKVGLPSCPHGRVITLCWDATRASLTKNSSPSLLGLTRFELGAAHCKMGQGSLETMRSMAPESASIPTGTLVP
ncbi:MAG: hypothetical protein AAF658_15310, partial [Myxococcota bacterium]